MSSSLKILLVCSHGGHLTEMRELADAYAGCEATYFTYDADTTRCLPKAIRVPNRPYSPVQFALNLIRAWRIIRRERPICVMSTGAEIAIAPFLIAKLMRVPTLYIECGCQFETPSLTGRVLSRVADKFLVQWPELLDAYHGRAEYAGSLIAGRDALPRVQKTRDDLNSREGTYHRAADAQERVPPGVVNL